MANRSRKLIKVVWRKRRRDTAVSPIYPVNTSREGWEIIIRLPATPSYRIFQACRICRRGVCWSTVSGNPSSSALVTYNLRANRHHSAFERFRFRWWASPLTASEARGQHRTHHHRKSPPSARMAVAIAHRAPTKCAHSRHVIPFFPPFFFFLPAPSPPSFSLRRAPGYFYAINFTSLRARWW